jgi:hypothetical protein
VHFQYYELYSFLTYELDNYSESDIMHIYNIILDSWDKNYLLDGADVAELMNEIYVNYALADERVVDWFFIDRLSDVIFGY